MELFWLVMGIWGLLAVVLCVPMAMSIREGMHSDAVERTRRERQWRDAFLGQGDREEKVRQAWQDGYVVKALEEEER